MQDAFSTRKHEGICPLRLINNYKQHFPRKQALSAKSPFSFGVDDNGNYGYIKDGADTVTPFNNVNVFYSNFWGSSSASLSFTKGKSYIVIAAIVSTHMSSAPSYIGSISNATKSRITYKYGQAQSRYSFVYEIYKITDVKDNAKLYISNPFEAPGIFATLIEI